MNGVGKSVCAGIGLLGFLLATTSAEAQDYQYSTINYPGATSTWIRGVADNGAVVGGWSTPSNSSGGSYEYYQGTFQQALGRGINDSGVSVGQGNESFGGVVTPITFPGATRTIAGGINNSGDIVGYYRTSSGDQYGFEDVGGQFTTISPPDAIISSQSGGTTFATGVNNNGEIVGYYTNTSGLGLGFTYINGVYSDIYVAGSVYSGALGVNDSGTVVGFYANASGVELPFMESGGVYTLLDIPGQAQDADVDADGINNAGTIVFTVLLQNGDSTNAVAVLPVTLASLQGGTPGDPTPLPIGAPIGDVTGSIGGEGSTDFYKLSWSGGSFEATLSLTGANSNSSYVFEILDSNGNVIQTLTLDESDGFSGTLSDLLTAGNYEIGLEADSPYDPDFNLQFVTPVGGVPEPATWAMLLMGMGGIGATLRSHRGRKAISA